ncbi:MAG: 5'-nucleotidase C-terminal domain-containing protein [Candidatus Gastranaerophilales bacterium]|nr:5'-nucleotidase C-terminal domain-containing protein [Candidatus Gastranaerophilales bacterium]
MIRKTLALICILSLQCLSAFADTGKEKYQFEVLSTTDMHGRCTVKNVSSGKKEVNSMERVATVVKQERKIFGDKVLLIDNGDLLQGTMITQYAINIAKYETHPMVTALERIGYDVWVMGNHEFNYKPMIRDLQAEFADGSDIEILGGNIVLKSDGKNFYKQNAKKGDPFYKPYMIKTFDFGDGKIVKVAVIGLGNANCANWDSKDNFPNLQFMSLDNPNGLLEVEINKYAKKIKDNHEADIIVVSAHSGKSTDTGLKTDKFLLESQVIGAAKKSHNIDLLIYGHDHQQNIEKLKNADGKEIYLVNGGGTAVTKNVFTVDFDNNNKVKGYTVTAEALELQNYKDDKELAKELQHWYDNTYDWASETIGTFGKGWNKYAYQTKNKTNSDLVLEQTEIIDLIHKAQIWGSWQLYDTKKIKGATVSVTSSSMADDKNRKVVYTPKDNDKISILTVSLLYKFGNNSLCVVDMHPHQLYNWMNRVANKLEIDKNGKARIKESESVHGTDTFYGIDYAFDLTKPEGKRVVYAKINGQNLTEMKKPVRVVMNNFRLAGAHSFFETTGLTENDCVFTSVKDLPQNLSSLQDIIAKYIWQKGKKVDKPEKNNKYNWYWEKGKILPDDTVTHSYNSKWCIYTKENQK